MKLVCHNCGQELPDDSAFCQYCGSSDIGDAEIKQGKEPEIGYITKTECVAEYTENYKGKFKIAVIAAVIFALITCYFGYQWNYYQSMYREVNEELKTTKRQLTTAQNNANSYQKKAGYFDTIKSKASSASNTNFFASNTVLKNPNKTRVVFDINYNGQYSISWEYDNEIILTHGNTSNGLVYIDVTYRGTGVKTITCTNSVNNQKIVIYCIGN